MSRPPIILDRCPSCSSRRARPFSVGVQALRRCRSCGLIRAERVDDPATVYTDDYLSACSGYGPDTTDPVVAAIGRAAAGHRLDLVARAMAPGTLLDVGCGSGELLDVARDRGWTAMGIEPVRASAERARARGHEVAVGTLEALDPGAGGFDLVVVSHVLEHLLEPVELLRQSMARVRSGGVLLVEVPNWRHPVRRKAGASWDQLCPGEHALYFTPRTLRTTMRRAGLHPRMSTVTVVRRRPVAERLGLGFAVIGLAHV